MWWFSSIVFLALQLIPLCSGIPRNELLSLKEFYNSISSYLKQANQLYIGNRNVSVMDILGLEIDENILKKYKEMDIGNEMQNVNEMADILDKWNEKKTDLKKDIESGFGGLDSLQELNFPSQVSNASEKISNRITELKEIPKSDEVDWNDFRSKLQTLDKDFINAKEKIDWYYDRIPDRKRNVDNFNSMKYVVRDFALNAKYIAQAYGLEIEKAVRYFNRVTDDSILKEYSAIAKNISQKMEILKELKDLSPKLIEVEREIQVLEELRNSKAPMNIKSFIEDLENSQFIVNDENQQESIYLEKEKEIEQTKIKLRLYERKLEYYKSQWVPFKSYLTNLDLLKSKLSQGNLKSNFEELRGCLDKIDTSVDFSEIEKEQMNIRKMYESLNFENNLRHAERLKEELEEWRPLIIEPYLEKIRLDLDKNREINPLNPPLKNPEMVQKETERIKERLRDFENLEKLETGRVGAPDQKISEFESALLVVTTGFYSSPIEKLRELENKTVEKLKEFVEFIDCYRNLTEGNSNFKSEVIDLLDTSQKAFDYNVRPLTSTIEAVFIFKSISKSVETLKEFKFGSPNNFPLNSEEIKEISDGLENIKTILDIQNSWRIIPDEFKNELSKFIEDLSIDSIPIIEIDPILDFINSVYQGGQKRKILRLLENIKKLQVDYSKKMEKMNVGLRKMKEWMGEQPVSSTDSCDCSEGMEISPDFCQPSCRALPVFPSEIPEPSESEN